MKTIVNKTIRDRYSWKGMIPTSHSSSRGTSCLTYQRNTDAILSRKAGLWPPRISKAKKEKAGSILIGICAAIVIWMLCLLAFGGWQMIGGN